SVLAFVPSGQVLPALLLSGVFVTFLVITYAGLISVMPRAGGDYVWQSRVLGGGVAFLLAVTGWWFILWYWAPVYANILNVHLFGVSNAYGQTFTDAGGSAVVPNLGFSPFLGDSLLLIPFLCFWILWPNWGATLYGEVRGASDFKRVMTGMMYGLWVTVAIAVVFILLATKFFGWQFFNGANLNYWNVVYAYIPHAPIGVWPYPPLLVGMFFHNSLLAGLLVLVFGAWFLGWAGTLFLSSTRVIFAAAFDRILPEKVADVSEKRHVTVWALVLMLAPSILVSAFYAYTSKFATYILDATLVIAITFFGTAIAAIILPWRKKELYQNSPIARYKVAGIPLITISGTISAAFLGFNL